VIVLVDSHSFGQVVRSLRVRRSLTQHGLGSAMGVSQNTVNRLEAGDKGGLRNGTFQALATCLAVDGPALRAFAAGQTDWSVPEAVTRLAGTPAGEADPDSVVERMLASRSAVSYAVDVATHSIPAADLLWSAFLADLERIGTVTKSSRERST
jgi:transcriptional regulator with XRE-family HTH domain